MVVSCWYLPRNNDVSTLVIWYIFVWMDLYFCIHQTVLTEDVARWQPTKVLIVYDKQTKNYLLEPKYKIWYTSFEEITYFAIVLLNIFLESFIILTNPFKAKLWFSFQIYTQKYFKLNVISYLYNCYLLGFQIEIARNIHNLPNNNLHLKIRSSHVVLNDEDWKKTWRNVDFGQMYIALRFSY